VSGGEEGCGDSEDSPLGPRRLDFLGASLQNPGRPFRHDGGILAEVRLAPEAARGRSKNEDEGSNRAGTAV